MCDDPQSCPAKQCCFRQTRSAEIEHLQSQLILVREQIRSAKAIQRENGVNYWLVPDATMQTLGAALKTVEQPK
jgi:hypothetical protein